MIPSGQMIGNDLVEVEVEILGNTGQQVCIWLRYVKLVFQQWKLLFKVCIAFWFPNTNSLTRILSPKWTACFCIAVREPGFSLGTLDFASNVPKV